jgi:hypothetical protein
VSTRKKPYQANYLPRQRAVGEATSNTFNFLPTATDKNVYVPARVVPARPAGAAHLSIPSRGLSC